MNRNRIFSNRSLLPIVILGVINRLIDPDFVFYHLKCWRSFSYTVTFSGWNIYSMDVYMYPPLWAYLLAVIFSPFSGLEDVLLPFGLMFMSLIHLLLIFISDILVTFLIYRRTENKKGILLPLALLFVSFMPYVGIHYGMFESVDVFLSLCGILLISKEYFFLGGFMFAISALTKQWTLLATGLIFLYILRWKKIEGLKYLLGTLVLPLVCLPFYLNDSQSFLDKAVFYRSTIAPDGYGLWGTLWTIYTDYNDEKGSHRGGTCTYMLPVNLGPRHLFVPGLQVLPSRTNDIRSLPIRLEKRPLAVGLLDLRGAVS